MPLEDDIAAKLRDFELNPSYERRVVAFYDFLGWRSKIAAAGPDPQQIGRLRRMLLRHSRSLSGQQQYAAPDIRFSTFSDNIVISQPANEANIIHVLGTLAAFQLVGVADGFLLRGGVTIGEIHHDNMTVFGPALNRAYELESQIADVPRVVVDDVTLKALRSPPFFLKNDGHVTFIDPFSHTFVRLLSSMEQGTIDVYATLGFPRQGDRRLNSVPSDALLRFALNGIKEQVRSPLGDKEWKKVAWVYDRLASALGIPPASSYPRVRPEDVQKGSG
jgi:hypothetical protein